MKFKPIKLEGERVVLRKIDIRNAPEIVKILNDKDVSKYMYRISYPYKIAHAKEFIKSTNEESYGWRVLLKDSKKLIGYAGMHGMNKFDNYKSAGLEIWIGKEHWGKGYAKEAISRVIDFGFKKLKLDKVYSKVYSPNEPSKNLLEKLGFKETSRTKSCEQCKLDDAWMDEIHYELPKKRWKK